MPPPPHFKLIIPNIIYYKESTRSGEVDDIEGICPPCFVHHVNIAHRMFSFHWLVPHSVGFEICVFYISVGLTHLHLLAVSHYHQAQQHTVYFLTVYNALIWFVTPRILWFLCKVDPPSQQIGITGVVDVESIFFVGPDHLWWCITRSMEQFHLFWFTAVHVCEMFKFVQIFFVDILVLDSYHLGNWSLLHP